MSSLIELFGRSKQGDRRAQEEWVTAARDRIYYRCKKMLKHEEDVR